MLQWLLLVVLPAAAAECQADAVIVSPGARVDSGREAEMSQYASRNVTFYTRTARQVFQDHRVPSVVDFLSLDVEGAEMHVLRGMDHDAVCFRNVALESNWREPMRSEMRTFLEARGYTYAGSELFDDYYQSTCARAAGR